MERISKWRVKEGYPSEKSDDTFIRAMFIEQLDKVIPITPESGDQKPTFHQKKQTTPSQDPC
jgi:hypothetical protein